MNFSLIKQLFIVSLCTLLLPWTGCQYVREMETLIRQQQSNTLEAFTKPLAETTKEQQFFQEKVSQSEKQQAPFFAPFSETPIIIDGYTDEWLSYFERELYTTTPNTKHYLKTTIFKQNLYVFLEINDPQISYYNPAQAALTHNDWIRIVTTDVEYQIFTSAPGSTQSFRYHRNNRSRVTNQQIVGYWQENANGYQVELQIPLDLIDTGIRIEAIDAQTQGNKVLASTRHKGLSPLLSPSKSLTDWLTPYTQNPWDLQVVDEQGWPLLSNHSATDTPPDLPLITRDNLGALLLNRLYRFFLEATLPVKFAHQWPLATTQLSTLNQRIPIEKLTPNGAKLNAQSHTFTQWYALSESNQSALLVIQPILQEQTILGYVIATQTENALLSFTNDALRRVMNLSVFAFLLVVTVLLGYAVILSLRIKHLKQNTENAIAEDGSITPFTPSTAKDEIGSLSQSYAALLQRVKNYNDYLQSLTHKLAHEIRTPLAIVKSSLEMLATVPKEQQQTYIDRALQGNQRLANILNAMSESTQVEQLVQHAEYRTIELAPLVKDLTQAYQTTYPEFKFDFQCRCNDSHIQGNPELMAQLIDKLVDNARDFTPQGECITLALTSREHELVIAVCNPGSSLPETMEGQLFDSLISVRDKKESDATHLGLGLYIVRLIATAHQGSVAAYNLPDAAGVCFEVRIPQQQKAL